MKKDQLARHGFTSLSLLLSRWLLRSSYSFDWYPYFKWNINSPLAMARKAFSLMAAFTQTLNIGVGFGSAQPTVDLGYSQYAGQNLGNGVSQFLGLRYAQAPTGDLRWRAPAAPDNTTGVLQAAQVSLPTAPARSKGVSSQSSNHHSSSKLQSKLTLSISMALYVLRVTSHPIQSMANQKTVFSLTFIHPPSLPALMAVVS